MPSVKVTEYLGERWSIWKDFPRLATLPNWFDLEEGVITFATQGTTHLCYLFDPKEEKFTWATLEKKGWSDWEEELHLLPPPNFIVGEDERARRAFLSISEYDGDEAFLSYNPLDGTLYWSKWQIDHFGAWEGELFLEAPPHADDSLQFFAATEASTSWIFAFAPAKWELYYSTLEDGVYDDWLSLPKVAVSPAWLEFGLKLDAAGFHGHFLLFAVLFDDELFQSSKSQLPDTNDKS